MNQLGTFIQVMTEKEAVKEGMEISGGIRFCKVEKIQGSYVEAFIFRPEQRIVPILDFIFG